MTKLSRKHAIKAADAETLTLTEQERKILVALRRLPRAERQAMRDLVVAWLNGVGPDTADVEAWVRNRTAEIEALVTPMAP